MPDCFSHTKKARVYSMVNMPKIEAKTNVYKLPCLLRLVKGLYLKVGVLVLKVGGLAQNIGLKPMLLAFHPDLLAF